MSNVKYSTGNQKEIFSNFWDRFSEQIKSGSGDVDFPSGSELLPHHITTVIRLPQSMAELLQDTLANMSG